jgi:hypothetical protein
VNRNELFASQVICDEGLGTETARIRGERSSRLRLTNCAVPICQWNHSSRAGAQSRYCFFPLSC